VLADVLSTRLRRRWQAGAAVVLASLSLARPAAARSIAAPPANAAPQSIVIDYLALARVHPAPSATLDPPPTDTGLRGAALAVADTNTTGRFTGQNFVLRTMTERDAAALRADFAHALAAGDRLFVTDLPADLLLSLADMPGAAKAVLLDATSEDDRLRGPDCRANLLHTMPSRAMLADALMQYLVTKTWTRIMLLTGRDPDDALYAAAIRNAAAKFQVSLSADRAWTFNPASQQADTGHYQVNDEVAKATQGVRYDVLVVADEAGNFGNDLAYRTDQPRPVAGTQGLVPAAWAHAMDEYASTQLQTRFARMAGRAMVSRDYGAWLAVRAIGEAATRSFSADPGRIIAYLHSPAFALSGYKGPELSFRPWDGQLRQPVLLADSVSLVSISPQPGFLHQTNELDTLGPDAPESTCRFSK
jgi:ABC transporter substrate binding protein (PQQ-dependent alcohol dehydrogenase system)